MSHNRTSTYSAPFRRNNLLGLHQYIASDRFPSLGNWDRSRTDDLYVVKGTSGRCHPVCMTIVAAISSDKTYLQPHRTYDPAYTRVEQIPKKAKLQFILTSPADDPDFSADYSLAIKRLRAIQEDVAASTGPRQHFIEGDNLKMNFLLFEEKEPEKEKSESESEDGECSCDDDESDNEEGSRTANQVAPTVPYEVESQYRTDWQIISRTHNNCIMEVYGLNELPVHYRDFHKVLQPGTTVAISFTLKHYAIRAKGSRELESDTYAAFVESVSILKAAEKRSKCKATPTRRPVPVSQLPSRGTLKLAADTFTPVRQNTPPRATENPSTAKAASSSRSAAPLAPGLPLPQFIEGSSADRALGSGIRPSRLSLMTKEDIARLIPLVLDRVNETTSGLQFYDNPTRPPSPTSANISVIVEHPGMVVQETEIKAPSNASDDSDSTLIGETNGGPETTVSLAANGTSDEAATQINVGPIEEDQDLPPLMPISDSEESGAEDGALDEGPAGDNFLLIRSPKPAAASPERKSKRRRRI